jgi:signal transduction histidine kinase
MAKTIMARAKVLIVDDEPANVRLLERILELVGGIQVCTTTDSRQALPLYHQFRPDLILLDLHMPHIDGFGVMEQLKNVIEAENFLPILVLTADITIETKRRALSAGARDFLTKPLDHSEVLLRIKNLLENRFLHLQMQSHNVLLEETVRERTRQLEETLAKLRSAQKQAIKQERLGALGMMAGGIAHDFNNALTMILGYGELLLGRIIGKATPEEIDHLTTIITAAQDATQIVSRLKDFYRPPEPQELRHAVNINQLVERTVSLTKPKWNDQPLSRGIHINVRYELGDVPEIAGDAAELREVLTNLIFNAVDAMPQGGTIDIRTVADEKAITISVTDTGTGMDDEVRQRCLEPFFTSKGEKGTGLGLAVVYGIIQRHGGEVEIESALGKGTTFYLRLPIVKPPQAAGAQSTQKLDRSLHILVVDDQPIICELIADYLVQEGHTVKTVASGGEALTAFRDEEFDLVITDELMAGMTGTQLAAAIKEFTPPRPVILLTGYGDVGEGERSRPDVDLVLGKPVTLQDLRRAVFDAVLKSSEAQAAAAPRNETAPAPLPEPATAEVSAS